MKRLLCFLLCLALLGQPALALEPALDAGAAAIASLARRPELWVYDYSRPVPQRPAVEDSAFANSLFMGNSLGEGFRLYSGLGTGFYETAVGMTASSALSRAGAAAGRDRVYLVLGINEIGQGAGAVAEQYGLLIDRLREAEPQAGIYVQSLLPVCESMLTAAQRSWHITNAHIDELNAALLERCWEKEVYYLDIHSALVNDQGGLDREKTWDGVHLTPEAYGIWLAYLRTHVV